MGTNLTIEKAKLEAAKQQELDRFHAYVTHLEGIARAAYVYQNDSTPNGSPEAEEARSILRNALLVPFEAFRK